MKLEGKLKELEKLYQSDKECLQRCKDIVEGLLNTKTINELPLIVELESEEYDDIHELIDSLFSESTRIKLQDGTNVTLEMYSCECFNDRKQHWYFYNVNDEFYICAECGMKMKYYSDIWNEVIDKFDLEECLYEEIALPKDWNENGIRRYFENYFKKQKIQQDRSEQRRVAMERERFLNYGCTDCIHMKRCECEYGNDEVNCDDYESR